MAELLGEAAIEGALASLPSWRLVDNALVRDVPVDRDAAEDLEAAVAKAADELNHHPVVASSYDSLRFTVWTHSAGGVTADEEDEPAPLLGFQRQQLGAQGRHQTPHVQRRPAEEPANLRPVPRFGPHRPRRLDGAHPPPVQAECRHAADDQTQRTPGQTRRFQKPLDSGQRVLHNHGRDSFSVGDNRAARGPHRSDRGRSLVF